MSSKGFYSNIFLIFYVLIFLIIGINFIQIWDLALVLIILVLLNIINKSYIDSRLDDSENETKLDTVIGILREMRHLNRGQSDVTRSEIDDLKRKFSTALGSLDDRIRNLENE